MHKTPPHEFVGIADINRLTKSVSGCIRFDRGSAQFPFPQELIPCLDTAKQRVIGQYYYHPELGGEPALREQIARFEAAHNHRTVPPHHLAISNGGYAGLYTVLRFVLKPGDEVITNTFCYEGFITILKNLDTKHIRVDMTDTTKIHNAITPKTKLILINSPENPTGSVYPQRELEAIVQYAQERNLWVVVDEVTNQIVYDRQEWFGLPVEYEKLALINSFGKNWFIPGITAGWIATANQELLSILTTPPFAESTNVDLFTQFFLEEMLRSLDFEAFNAKYVAILQARTHTMQQALVDAQLVANTPQGGMNFYVDLKTDTQQLFFELLKENVGIVPGYFFEGKPSTFARIGFGAVDESDIRQGIQTISDVINRNG